MLRVGARFLGAVAPVLGIVDWDLGHSSPAPSGQRGIGRLHSPELCVAFMPPFAFSLRHFGPSAAIDAAWLLKKKVRLPYPLITARIDSAPWHRSRCRAARA